MISASLSHLSARPRTTWSSPRYPRVMALGALLTACCGGGTPAPQGQDSSATNTTQDSAATPATVAVVPAELPQPLVMADGSSDPDPVQPMADVHFPEDDEPLENVSCRGRCPSPYVMGLTKKDRGQIEARIRYCSNTANKRGELNNGSVSVTALIDGTGKASEVKLTSTGEVSQPVLDCVRSLVTSAPFTSDHDTKRTTQATGKIGP